MIQSLLARGRQRRLFQLILGQLVVALAAVFGGAILLLLIGTQLLDWYWLGVLFTASMAYGTWRVMAKAPSTYQVAQLIDARLHLHDAISTAYHFSTADHVPAEEELRRAQSQQAEYAARTADLQVALPHQAPRALYPMLALAAVALSLFGVRYLVTHSLDTRPSLVAMAFDSFFTPSPDKPNNEARNRMKRPEDTEFDKLGVATDAENQRPDLDPGADATNVVDTPDVNASQNQNPDSAKMKAKTDESKVKAEGKDEGEEEGEKGKDSGEAKNSSDQNNNSGDQSGKDQKQQKDQKGQPKDGEQSNLLDKMKDAMQNMLNKLKMQGNQSQQQQQAQNSKDGQQSGKGQQKGDEKGQQDKNQQQGGQGEAKDQKAEAQGQQGQKNENAQGKGGDQSKQPQNADAKSGVGKSDGNKDIQMAEQAKAMGKLSEILGKRQKDLTGEVMIEVSSGKQQLKTAYSNEKGTHKDAGGEINRDEVPLIYQKYVEKYFDQIHAKPPEPAKPAGAPTSPTN